MKAANIKAITDSWIRSVNCCQPLEKPVQSLPLLRRLCFVDLFGRYLKISDQPVTDCGLIWSWEKCLVLAKSEATKVFSWVKVSLVHCSHNNCNAFTLSTIYDQLNKTEFQSEFYYKGTFLKVLQICSWWVYTVDAQAVTWIWHCVNSRASWRSISADSHSMTRRVLKKTDMEHQAHNRIFLILNYSMIS